MRNLLLVGGGGFLGSVARYVVGGFVLHSTGAARFPYATLAVNLTGCLAIGLIAGMAERASMLTAETRLFLLTGFLGGYTTFSAFAYETIFLAREQAWVSAVSNLMLHVALGLVAVLAGSRLATFLVT